MILRSLLEGLFKRGCVLFITSNRHPDKLYWNGIQRKSFLPCIELLKQRMEVINLDTDYDYRQIERELGQVYYYPLSDAVAKTMDEVYERFLQGSESSDTELEVFGRKIKISQQNKDRKVARFTFNQLCQSAHSAADYLEIVKNYRVILLESVPVLDIHMKDSVRRFITLIDLMYENKVALVCSAEDTLENLFKVDSVSADDEVVFAFRRCLSRLKEMQSKDWMSE
jgi:protein AFG1